MAAEEKKEKKAKKKKAKKKHRFFWFTVKVQVLLLLLVLGALGYYYFGGYAQEVQKLKEEAVNLVHNSSEESFILSRTSSVYDADGNLISEKKGDVNAEYVKYEDIPAEFITTIISIEDKKFYKHNGVDYKAILRAVKARIEEGRSTQGGSTITMQLAKLVYMQHADTWQYKVQQMFLAQELEKDYNKTKILEFYLNNIYFANGYYGIRAACSGYFDCELNELSLSQIAFLCAIPNSPTYYDPVTNFDHTIERRNLILKNLLDDGKIDQQAFNAAANETIVLKRAQNSNTMKSNYVETYVYYCATRALMENEGFVFCTEFESEEEKETYYEEYDELYTSCQKKLFTGGYKIYTSINMEQQALLQDAVDTTMAEFTDVNEEGVYTMQASAVCIDNETGYVTAIVGGREQDFLMYSLNRAYQSFRQPGSSIKPLIVYTPIFERGYMPEDTVVDEPFEGGPQNATGTYKGEVTIRYAVEQSINTVAWKLYTELTPEVGLEYLKNMNFSKIVPADVAPATSIGGFTNGVSALEMAAAYAAIEHDGLYRKPTCIETIIDADENIIYATTNPETVIYKETAARIMTDVLIGVMERGTGKNYKLSEMPCAGKTGTTNSYKDGWFVGYTRYYTTSVWMGYDLPKEITELRRTPYAAMIWNAYMEAVHKDLPVLQFLPYAQLSDEFQQQLQEGGEAGQEPQPEGGEAGQEPQPEGGEAGQEPQPEGGEAGQEPQPEGGEAGQEPQ